MRQDGKEGGLVLKLNENIPVIIKINDKIVKVYCLRDGSEIKARFVAPKEVLILGCHLNKENEGHF